MATARGARVAAVGAVVVLLAPGCAPGTAGSGPGDRPPRGSEAWPPTNATECLRTRPPVLDPVRWPAALAVRDWRQPVHDARVELMLCARGPVTPAERSDRFVVTVRTTGGVRAPADAGMQWTGREDLVAPLAVEVSGPGSLEVVLGSPVTDGTHTATQHMTVYVLEGDDGLVVSECREPASCRWD